MDARSTLTAGGLPSTTVRVMDVEAVRKPLLTSTLNSNRINNEQNYWIGLAAILVRHLGFLDYFAQVKKKAKSAQK